MNYLILSNSEIVIDGKIYREVLGKTGLVSAAYSQAVKVGLESCNIFKNIEVDIKEK
jgi:hypothetical protein